MALILLAALPCMVVLGTDSLAVARAVLVATVAASSSLAVENLLENAPVKYTLAGGSVDVSLKRDGSTVELTVRDPGFGIPAADRDRPFSRSARGVLAIQGVGLG